MQVISTKELEKLYGQMDIQAVLFVQTIDYRLDESRHSSAFMLGFQRGLQQRYELSGVNDLILARKKVKSELADFFSETGYKENYFKAIDSSDYTAGENFITAESLMGNLAALTAIEWKLLSELYTQELRSQLLTESMPVKYESQEEINMRDLLKLTLALLWERDNINYLEREQGGISAEKKEYLKKISDESFCAVIDNIIENLGFQKSIGFFSNELALALKGCHYDSEMFPIHWDVSPEIHTKYDKFLESFEYLFPFYQSAESPYSSWHLINADFLPGNELFWDHLSTKHGKIYEGLISQMQIYLKDGYISKGTGHIPILNAEEEYVQTEQIYLLNLNSLMATAAPNLLSRLNLPASKNELNRDYAFVAYQFIIENKPIQCRKLLLEELNLTPTYLT